MGRGWGAALAVGALMAATACDGRSGAGVDSVAAAYQFLYAMMDRHGSGATPRLPQSYTGGTLDYTSSTTYDNALVIDALIARGTAEDGQRARVLGDTLVLVQRADPAGDGRLRASYQAGVVPAPGAVPTPGVVPAPGGAAGGVVVTNPTSDVGAMAWAGRALLHLADQTHDSSYVDSAARLAGWIQAHAYDTRGRGGYTGGLAADGQPLRWKSTEHNLDLVSFFTALAGTTGDPAWTDRAGHARQFVVSMYDPAGPRFATGTVEDGVAINPAFIPADAQTWSYLVLRDPAFAGTLDYAATAFAAQDGPFRGISATADERSAVWFEGTAHLALARLLRDRRGDAQKYLDSIALAQRSAPNQDGQGIVATSRDTPVNAQGVRLYASRHTGTTAWYVLAAQRWNPLR